MEKLRQKMTRKSEEKNKYPEIYKKNKIELTQNEQQSHFDLHCTNT